ncbi:MAG: accessory factor UbiK family protein [Rickettsiales bacterium]|nr:accessory factor UbiK family protein [Rickettsiales bacterium]
MQKDHKFFEDISKLATGATSTMLDMKREMESMIKSQIEHFLLGMNLVTREEFEAVRAMAEKARLENETLKSRLDELEATDKAQ